LSDIVVCCRIIVRKLITKTQPQRITGTNNKMNFINKLQADNSELTEKLNQVNQELTHFMSYLSGPKFTGIENNFVNAREVLDRVTEIRVLINK